MLSSELKHSRRATPSHFVDMRGSFRVQCRLLRVYRHDRRLTTHNSLPAVLSPISAGAMLRSPAAAGWNRRCAMTFRALAIDLNGTLLTREETVTEPNRRA